MSNDYNNPAFKKLLQKLQEESWQLELLISGFAIFGLFQAFEPLEILFTELKYDDQVIPAIIITVILISCVILTFNLLLHVILRGLWIGALGLRYVSGDIDYDYLNYSPKFTKYLKKKVGSFDRYIARLENYCSIIFAASFLLIFYVLAFAFTAFTIFLIANYIIGNDSYGNWGKIIGIPLILFIVLGMLLTFIDFITQGWLKKKQWISRIYFPVYWVFSFITLAFLYRPIVYNFLDNKFGKRISLILIPLYITLLIATSFNYKNSNYFHKNLNSNEIIANSSNYENLLIEKDDFASDITISSKVISNNYINVFMLFEEDIENHVFDFNPNLKPKTDVRGFSSDIIYSTHNKSRTYDSLRKAYIKTVNDIYSIKIDSIDYDTNFVVSFNTKKQKGLETYLGIKELSEGKHLLRVIRKYIIKNDTTAYEIKKIPFWYYPD
ncbi:hypothetical protein ACFQ1Q_09150 [Winogradskyella litorisediminis]|uniref:Uncharacterized protein n=1 Tax=Winogradskyella litorisediminis TaxID=1156618 RepID=A0ABW3N6U6_9FLAO